MTIEAIPTRKNLIAQDNAFIVDSLAEMLPELTGVAVACITRDGEVCTMVGSTDDAPALLGAVEMMKHRMIMDME